MLHSKIRAAAAAAMLSPAEDTFIKTKLLPNRTTEHAHDNALNNA